jgi:hypothetical protein
VLLASPRGRMPCVTGVAQMLLVLGADARRSALGARRSALGARRAARGARRVACGARHAARGTVLDRPRVRKSLLAIPVAETLRRTRWPRTRSHKCLLGSCSCNKHGARRLAHSTRARRREPEQRVQEHCSKTWRAFCARKKRAQFYLPRHHTAQDLRPFSGRKTRATFCIVLFIILCLSLLMLSK